MKPHIACLLDDVSARARAIEIRIDAELELSMAATVVMDRQCDAGATLTSYAPSASLALERALVAAVAWSNAQPGTRRPVVAHEDPTSMLLDLLERCAVQVDVDLAREANAAIAVVRARC